MPVCRTLVNTYDSDDDDDIRDLITYWWLRYRNKTIKWMHRYMVLWLLLFKTSPSKKCHFIRWPWGLFPEGSEPFLLTTLTKCNLYQVSLWQSGLPFPRYNSPWKFKVKGSPVNAASSWLFSLVFHIRASYRLPSLSFHDNLASHSRDTIWPWKFKVKGEGQRSRSKVT